MAPSFPTSIKSFTTKTNNVDTINASHVNDLQDEVAAIETLLGEASSRRGTWSPVLTFSTTNPTAVTYNANNGGMYAQFGSLVWFSGRLQFDSYTGSPAGNARISIPSTAANISVAQQSIASMLGISGFVTLWPSTMRITPNSAVGELYAYSSSAASSNLTATHVTSAGVAVVFNGFYWAA